MQLQLFDKNYNFTFLQEQLKKLIDKGMEEGRSENVKKLYQSANLRVKNYCKSSSEKKDDVRFRFAMTIKKHFKNKNLTSKEIYRMSVEEVFLRKK
ncbi:hypothetical protein AVL50_32070 [Flammeovirga sp. SJP92]|nr:hypothetical protein AVL50_32070 [Flammeovirga sp. SJP92]